MNDQTTSSERKLCDEIIDDADMHFAVKHISEDIKQLSGQAKERIYALLGRVMCEYEDRINRC